MSGGAHQAGERARRGLRRFESEREDMIDLIRRRGVTDEALITAMLRVDRHEFVGGAFLNRSYDDSALPIGSSQTISQPYTVAFMTQALGARPGDRVLEVGTGSGYQAAVLAEMGIRVFTIERHMALPRRGEEALREVPLQHCVEMRGRHARVERPRLSHPGRTIEDVPQVNGGILPHS